MNAIVIVPTYNERDNLASLIPAILEVDVARSDYQIRILGRLQQEGQILRTVGKIGIHLDHVVVALGQGIPETVDVGGAESLLASPLQYPYPVGPHSERFRQLAGAIGRTVVNDEDIQRTVPGGRVENWSLVRRFISKGGNLYARSLLSLPIKDCTGGFKCFRRRVLEALDLDSVRSDGYGFQVEMNYLCQRAGFKIIEVPIVIPDRTAGQSKMSAPIFLEAVTLVLQLRGQEPSFSPEFASDPEPSSTSYQDQRDGATS